MSDERRESGVESWIAEERLRPGPMRAWWVACVAGLCAAVFVGLTILGTTPATHTTSEDAFQEGGSWLSGYASTVLAGRLWSAAAAATAVFATAWAARRLLHSDWSALLAASLVALDPMLLVYGRLALPIAPAMAAGVLALALFLSPRASLHWLGSAAFAFGVLLEPDLIYWAVPFALLTLFRGHIYAAPKHFAIATTQTALIPGLAAAASFLAGSQNLGCTTPSRFDAIILRQVPDLGHGLYALPNLTTWFAGAGAVAVMSFIALAAVLTGFRMQRLPGRLQLRLDQPLRREHGRILWIALLALTAPTAWFFLPVFALALAAAVREFGRDAKAFAIVVGLVLIGLAVAGVVRFAFLLQGGVTGEELQQLLELIPWAHVDSCA